MIINGIKEVKNLNFQHKRNLNSLLLGVEFKFYIRILNSYIFCPNKQWK